MISAATLLTVEIELEKATYAYFAARRENNGLLDSVARESYALARYRAASSAMAELELAMQ